MAGDVTSGKCTLTTPLGKDVLRLESMSAAEGISQLFRMQMEMVSHEGGIQFEQIVGKAVSVELALDGGSSRYFHGIVSRFWQGGAYLMDAEDQGFVTYQADVVPWLWTLSRATNCRVFEKKTALDIIRTVFDDLGYGENEEYEFASLGETHEEIEYCVQYRETDFNFVSRLMEEQGLAYYFRHEADKHTMVIFDTSGSCPDCSGYETVLYGGIGGSAGQEKVVEGWTTQQVWPPGKYALNGYDLENPSDDLLAPTQGALSMGGNAKFEIYDYPSYYTKSVNGKRYVKFRMEAEEAASHVVQGRGCCGAFTPGTHIKLKGHFCDEFNGKRYLITGVQHSIRQVISRADGGSSYENSFTCLPDRIPYRPVQKTPKPSVQGSQTAVVVGPSGEEIHCDKYGRIRIQFHWDRDGKNDGTDVCWARVSQTSAGKRWGSIFIPRIGQEVVVTFLDGDPDRPLVTGVVYNAEQMPPYELDVNKTMSGIKTRSTKDGNPETFNEIRFEDKKGEELFYVHAEKDREKVVENDERDDIGNDRTISVGHDQTSEIGNDFRETVRKNKTVAVGEDHTETVTKNETLKVEGERTRSVGGTESIAIDKDQGISVDGNRTINVSKSQMVQVDDDSTAKVGKNFGIEAGDEIALEVGKARIVMKKNGDIVIEGKKLNFKASGDIVMKGSKVKQN